MITIFMTLDGSQLLLHHGEDKITFAELPKDCRDWKLAKYQKEGKHFGQLFLHSPSQGAKPVWVFKLKFLDLPDEKETRQGKDEAGERSRKSQ